jgi:hypothetical protein
MAPDVEDLRKHVESQIVAERARQTIAQRLRQAAVRGKANIKAKQQDLASSAKSSLSLVRRKISNDRGE